MATPRQAARGSNLTDTLESPNQKPMQGYFEPALSLSQQHAAALEIKSAVNVLVCLGNPPYDRTPAADAAGGWVRHGDEGVDDRPILEDFLEPAQLAGHGVHIKNLYNPICIFLALGPVEGVRAEWR